MPDKSSDAIYFASPAEFREWLDRHHETARELWVGFHKKATGRPSLTWSESVDEALCFGWIDGIRKSASAEAYVIRFTPRKTTSIWSNINIKKVESLLERGLMRPAGVRAYECRDTKKSGIYAFEQRKKARLTAAEKKQFRAKKTAWKFFEAQPPGYRQLVTHWVSSAKRPDTRARRLATLIDDSAAGRRILQLQRRDGA